MSNYKSQHPARHQNHYSNAYARASWVCHYCGRKGHIKPYIYKLYVRPFYHNYSCPSWNIANDVCR